MATEFTLVELPGTMGSTNHNHTASSADSPDLPMALAAVARTSWCVLAIMSLTAVAAGIHLVSVTHKHALTATSRAPGHGTHPHTRSHAHAYSCTHTRALTYKVWSLHSVPVKQRRRFILDHETAYSLPYAVAPWSFVLLFVGLITGGLSLALKPQTPGVFRYAIAIGVVIGVTIAVPMVYTSGLVMESAFRPWGLADQELLLESRENHRSSHRRPLYGVSDLSGERQGEHQMPVHVSKPAPPTLSRAGVHPIRVEHIDSSDAADAGLGTWFEKDGVAATPPNGATGRSGPCRELHGALADLGLLEHEDRLHEARLTWPLLLRVADRVLLDRSLESSGMGRAGDRIALILRIIAAGPGAG
mmetsp:Transcript_23334/g.62689  ORF Transcript_23334/g.62689 Transcript_23334/m.62689 type:complete len:360 (-) Transcript_23334:581-1660(-)